jgi:hypothetical protein
VVAQLDLNLHTLLEVVVELEVTENHQVLLQVVILHHL